LLEYDDIFAGSHVIEAKVNELVVESRAEIQRVLDMGGAVAAVESGYMKGQMVGSHAERRARVEAGDLVIVGVNAFTTTEPNPLLADIDNAIQTVDPEVEAIAIADLQVWRNGRDAARVDAAISQLRTDASSDVNLIAATLECARAGVTTGEWSETLREVFGEYRAPTGVSGVIATAEPSESLRAVRESVRATGEELGFGQDWGTTTAMLTTFATTLTLGFETSRALQSADRITRLADLNHGAGRVIGGTFGAFGAPTAATTTTTRRTTG
jgi:(2R)-ethylmalonyl-CoA mutase